MGQGDKVQACSVSMFVFPRCVVVTTYFPAIVPCIMLTRERHGGEAEKER